MVGVLTFMSRINLVSAELSIKKSYNLGDSRLNSLSVLEGQRSCVGGPRMFESGLDICSRFCKGKWKNRVIFVLDSL